MMTDTEILELAEQFKFCYRDEDDFRSWKVSPSIILRFAQAVYAKGHSEGYDAGSMGF